MRENSVGAALTPGERSSRWFGVTGPNGLSVVEAKGTQPRRQRRLEKTIRSPRMSRIRGDYREIDFISGVAPLRPAGDRSGARRGRHFSARRPGSKVGKK